MEKTPVNAPDHQQHNVGPWAEDVRVSLRVSQVCLLQSTSHSKEAVLVEIGH